MTRNLEYFSEFQLGLIQTLADVSPLHLSYGLMDGLPCIWLCADDGETIFRWTFGQEPMLSDRQQLVPMTEFVDSLNDLIAGYRKSADDSIDFGDTNG